MIGESDDPTDLETRIEVPAPTCCERWPACTCLRDSKILSLSNGPHGEVFQNPREWDSIVTPGASYTVMYTRDDRIVVGVAWSDPPDADYIWLTLEQWQERCLRDGARLVDGSNYRAVGTGNTTVLQGTRR